MCKTPPRERLPQLFRKRMVRVKLDLPQLSPEGPSCRRRAVADCQSIQPANRVKGRSSAQISNRHNSSTANVLTLDRAGDYDSIPTRWKKPLARDHFVAGQLWRGEQIANDR